MQNAQAKPRDLNTDILKIIACLMVIINHTSVPFTKFSSVSGSWIVAAILFYLSKTAVPIFFMITGMYIFNKERDYNYSLKKLGHFAFLLVFWDYFYWIAQNGISNFYHIDSFVVSLWQGPASTHLWYLYTLVGFYAMLPILGRIVNTFSKKDYHYFLGLWFLFTSLIPTVIVFTKIPSISSYLQVNLFIGFIGFFVLGSYLMKYPLSRLWSILLLLSGLIISVVITTYYSKQSGKVFLGMDGVQYVPLLLTSTGLYSLIRTFDFGKVKGKLITNISSLTLGIYLLHIFVIRQFMKIQVNQSFLNKNGIALVLVYLIFEVLIFIVAAVLTWIIKQVPYVKKIVS